MIQPVALIAILVATLCWSGNFVIGREIHGLINPFALAFWRHVVAGVLLLPVIIRPFWHCRRAIIKEWSTLVGMAASGIVLFNVGTYAALQTIPAVRSVMILAFAPMAILIFSRFLTQARLTWHQILGVVVSFFGIAFLEIKDTSASLVSIFGIGVGDVWMAAAVIGFALNTVLVRVRRLPKEIPTIVAYGVAVMLGVVGLIPEYMTTLSDGPPIARIDLWSAIVFLALGPSITAYLCWFYAIRMAGPHRVGNCILLVPLFGAILGVLFLSERFTGTLAVGGGMVFAGVLMSFIDPGSRSRPSLAAGEGGASAVVT
jgi:drug/metabolite transporter (DMT)-like permease